MKVGRCSLLIFFSLSQGNSRQFDTLSFECFSLFIYVSMRIECLVTGYPLRHAGGGELLVSLFWRWSKLCCCCYAPIFPPEVILIRSP